jgi:hypothetical protein
MKLGVESLHADGILEKSWEKESILGILVVLKRKSD